MARIRALAQKVINFMKITTLRPRGTKGDFGRPGAPGTIKKSLHLLPLLPRPPQSCTFAPKVQKCKDFIKIQIFAQKCSLAGHGHGRQGVYGCSCRPSAHSDGMRRAQKFLARNVFKLHHTNIRNVSKCGIQSHRATLEATLWPTPGFAYRANVSLWPFGRRNGPDADFIDLDRF